MVTKLPRKIRKVEFITDESGNTFMIFGLAFVPAMFMIGAAIDYTRLAITRSALQQGTDAAILSVASKMTSDTTVAQAKEQAQVLLNAHPKLANAVVTNVTISEDKQTLCATTQATVKNAFMQMAAITNTNSSVKSCANLAGGVDPNATFEIALVLDNSLSMQSTAGGKSKIQALRDAATSFVNTMYAKSNNVKMSVTPFSAAVRVLDPDISANRTLSWIDTQGNNSQHWVAFGGKSAANGQGFTNRFDIFKKLKSAKSSWDWGGCFEGPKYPLNVNDTAATTSNAETLFVPYLAADEPLVYEVKNKKESDVLRYNNHYLAGSRCEKCNTTEQWNLLTKASKYKSPSTDGNGAGPNSNCPTASSQTLLQLTSTQSTVVDRISKLKENGYTNLHEGFMWGWRTISPNAPFAASVAYNAEKNRKIMIFMTDGFNNWQSQKNTVTGSTYQALGYYSYNGTKNDRFPDGSTTNGDGVNYQNKLKAAANSKSDYHDDSRDMQDALTLESCTNAKAAGVEIFTIGFSTKNDPIDEQGLALMKACATNEAHYYKAEDASQLNAAFSQIGIGLGKLHLSQ